MSRSGSKFHCGGGGGGGGGISRRREPVGGRAHKAATMGSDQSLIEQTSVRPAAAAVPSTTAPRDDLSAIFTS